MRMESLSLRMLSIAAGLFTATLAFVAFRHSHTPRAVEVFVPDVQKLQAELDDLNARIANFVPDDVQVRDELRIARVRLIGLEGELDEMRVRSAALQR